VDAEGRLDRAALAARALSGPEGQKKLEAILHPLIRAELAREVEARGRAGARAVVIEAAMILESGHRGFYDLLVVVVASPEERVRRAAERGMDPEEARRRLALQWSDEEKAAAADLVIVNDGSLDTLAARADELAERIRTAARAR
jgi:dephospho-CoA kinase